MEPFSMKPNKIERLRCWLKSHGAQWNCVDFSEFDASVHEESQIDDQHRHVVEMAKYRSDPERGVHAITNIPPDTLLISIPRRCIITDEMGQSLPLGQRIMSTGVKLNFPNLMYLMLFVLWDMKVNGADSFFHPYYDTLPRSFSHVPIFWTSDQLKYLEGSFLLTDIGDRIRATEEDYNEVRRLAQQKRNQQPYRNHNDNTDMAWFEGVSLEEFSWARMVVISRNFAFWDANMKRISALVPLADLMNHQRPPDAMWTFDTEKDAFVIKSLVEIPVGSPIYDSYGQKSNHRYLLNYGFSIENNFELDGTCPNQVSIDLEVSISDPFFLRKLKYWLEDEDPDDRDKLMMVYSELNNNPGILLDQSNNSEHLIDLRSEKGDHGEVHNDCRGGIDQQRTNDPHDLNTSERDIKDQKCRCRSVRVSISDDENTALLVSMLRTLACNEDDLDELTGTVFTEGIPVVPRAFDDIMDPISLRNEMVAMTLLTDIMIDHLARYPTTIQEDISDLLDEDTYPPFSNQRNAKIQVKGEKEVLCHFLLWGQSATHVLAAMLREGNECIDPDDDVVDIYFHDKEDYSDHLPSVEEALDELRQAELHWSIMQYCESIVWRLRRQVRDVEKLAINCAD